MSYNGWTNRETWLVNVWFKPESSEDVDLAKEQLEEEAEKIETGCLKDMLSLDSVNWQELREVFEDE